ncbi:MAG: DNA methyltransferase [Anaerolineae bacterium]
MPVCGGQAFKTPGQKTSSTQKPEELLRRIIPASSKPGDLVLDPL